MVPRLGRGGLQVAAVLIAAGTWWLLSIVTAHGLATSSAELIPAQLVLGLGIGMLISPLFDFILASVADHEVGSASGVLNAVQQLASAIGVAAVLFALAWALPRRPREEQVAAADPGTPEPVLSSAQASDR